MFQFKKILQASEFTFDSYLVDTANSTITFSYHVKFKSGKEKVYKDILCLEGVTPDLWEKVPKEVLEPTLLALHIMIGINYWSVYLTKNIKIKNFKLTYEQAQFWNSLYLNGLSEFFYLNKIDFRDLINFPYDDSIPTPVPTKLELPERALVLNGAGKDSILSAEILKTSGIPFDYFVFAPTPSHFRIAKLVGAKTITARRKRDYRKTFAIQFLRLSTTYPSVSTFTFIATLFAGLLGYNQIVFSNERSADFGNLDYLGLPVNHQWCKSTEAETMIGNYIHKFITPEIKLYSPLRKFSELEIVNRFVKYLKYFCEFTSCNTYFHLPFIQQFLSHKNYWCKECAKCVFLFACFSAFLPKKEVINIFGANLYSKKNLLPLFRQILGIEGFKPLDCVGEPWEMILAMHYADQKKEYSGDLAMKVFKQYFPENYNFEELKQKM